MRVGKLENNEESEMTTRSLRITQSNEMKLNKYNSFEETQIYRFGI